ncbi:UNVERIFIED_CONTAM: Aspartyl protease family protein [Sesamum angustifolium]|uniref:Aspartyl protease family protein n=1 Tax=Sesamum angustifolium TaxID=2727405 RepID=A0AAW2M9K3_9LAMI
MSAAFRKLMAKYKTAPAYSILDTCYDFSGLTTVSIPTISFTFGGNVKVDLAPSGILVTISASRVCLAFAGNKNANDVAIFGNSQQKTLEVVYDVGGGNLGFGSAGCK